MIIVRTGPKRVDLLTNILVTGVHVGCKDSGLLT